MVVMLINQFYLNDHTSVISKELNMKERYIQNTVRYINVNNTTAFEDKLSNYQLVQHGQ